MSNDLDDTVRLTQEEVIASLEEIRLKKTELNAKHIMSMPMSDEELYSLERIDVDVLQLESLLEWLIERDSKDGGWIK